MDCQSCVSVTKVDALPTPRTVFCRHSRFWFDIQWAARETSLLCQVLHSYDDVTHAVTRRVADVEPLVGVEQRAEGKVQ